MNYTLVTEADQTHHQKMTQCSVNVEFFLFVPLAELTPKLLADGCCGVAPTPIVVVQTFMNEFFISIEVYSIFSRSPVEGCDAYFVSTVFGW